MALGLMPKTVLLTTGEGLRQVLYKNGGVGGDGVYCRTKGWKGVTKFRGLSLA